MLRRPPRAGRRRASRDRAAGDDLRPPARRPSGRGLRAAPSSSSSATIPPSYGAPLWLPDAARRHARAARAARRRASWPPSSRCTSRGSIFGARCSTAFAPAVALFELAFARFCGARGAGRGGAHARGRDAARARRVRAQARTAGGAADLARRTPAAGIQTLPAGAAAPSDGSRADRLAAERQRGQHTEAVRRAERRAQRLEEQLAASADEPRSRRTSSCTGGARRCGRRTRTLYLIDRVLTLDAADARAARAGRRAARPRRRRHGGAALLADAARAGAGSSVPGRRARPRAAHHGGRARAVRRGRRRPGGRVARAAARAGRARRGQPSAAAATSTSRAGASSASRWCTTTSSWAS